MSQLLPIIMEEIEKCGPITFARFMELALYHPRFGYYEQGFSQTGRAGDFFTNVSVGSLFGEILGFDFVQRVQSLPSGPIYLIEAGAHDGTLAKDILGHLQTFHPDLLPRLTYLIVEPSARRAYRQHEVLEGFQKQVKWIKAFSELPAPVQGICFSNELLDAFPVHLVKWSSKSHAWIEQLVSTKRDSLELQPATISLPASLKKLLPELPEGLQKVLPDGFTLELSPTRLDWWQGAATALQRGWMIAFDYGGLREWFLQPERADGTIRGYAKHRLMRDVLREPGSQDITASVNFSELIEIGEGCGFTTELFSQQGNCLKQIVESIDAAPSKFPLWTAHRFRQLASLIHPEHLGRSFKVLVQKKN